MKEAIKKQYIGEGTSTRTPETYYSTSKQLPILQTKQPVKAASNLLGQDLFDDDLLREINGESVEEPSQEKPVPSDEVQSPIVTVTSNNIIDEISQSSPTDSQSSASDKPNVDKEPKEPLYFKKKKF